MIGFAESFLVWLVSTTSPALLGLFTIVWVGTRTRAVFPAAFGLGIFLWFFLDTIGGSASLDVSDGFTGGVAQVAVVVLFIVGLVFFFWADRNRHVFDVESAVGKYGVAIPLLVAIAVGIHGLGEGSAFGSTASSTPSTSLLDAFGGLTAGIAYVLHKGLEPMMIGACYSAYSREPAKSVSGRARDLALLGVVFVIPSLLGAATGYFLTYDATYFFALGTGTSIYAAIRLAGPLFTRAEASRPRDSLKIVMVLVLGFLAIYIAALFHS